MASKKSDVDRIQTAIITNDLGTVKELVESGFSLNELSISENTKAPLHYATEDRKVKIVRYLLEAGADPNLLSGHHPEAALHMACSEGDVKCVEALLQYGADVNLPTCYGVLPIIDAIKSKRAITLLKILVDAGAELAPKGNFGPVHEAARKTDPSIIDFLIDGGCDVNAWVADITPLMQAVSAFDTVRVYPSLRGFSSKPSLKIVMKLLEHGAKPGAVYRKNCSSEKGRDNTGMSIVEYANDVGLPKALLALLGDGGSKKKSTGTKQAKVRRKSSSRLRLPISELVQEFKNWLRQENSEIANSLRRGARAASLKKLATETEQAIPDDFTSMWSTFDGQNPGAEGAISIESTDSTWSLLPVKDVVREWNVWYDLLVSDEFEGASVSTDGKVRSVWYHEDWMPIASDGAGNFLCLDLNPTSKGRAGQVIELNHEDPYRGVVSRSLKHLILESQGISV